MIVALGNDHAGFPLREIAMAAIRSAGHEVLDCGAFTLDAGDDYPDFSAAVARALQGGRAERAVLICGSGVGASIAANKFKDIRAALCHDTFSAHQGVEDDSMNILTLGARVIGPSLAQELITTFLKARFSNAERHVRRVNKVRGFENEL